MIVASIVENSFTGSEFLQYKNEALLSNEDILGYSIILDSSYLANINDEDSAYIGNDFIYAPYINRVDGSINTMFIEDAVNEEFYTIPQANGQPYITEPYKYEIDGKNIPMVSVGVPITIENNFIGVVIADFSINFLNEIIQGNLPDTAIQRIISTQGTIISDSASEAIYRQVLHNLHRTGIRLKQRFKMVKFGLFMHSLKRLMQKRILSFYQLN